MKCQKCDTATIEHHLFTSTYFRCPKCEPVSQSKTEGQAFADKNVWLTKSELLAAVEAPGLVFPIKIRWKQNGRILEGNTNRKDLEHLFEKGQGGVEGYQLVRE